MVSALMIAGAVALILFGIRFLRKGLERLFGARLGWWMQRLARTRFRAFLAGLLVSTASPSSTTLSMLTVQSIQAGYLSTRQSLAVALGSNIGLTFTALLIGMNIDSYAPILILLGVALFQYTRTNKSRGTGQVILSLGLIFLAVHLIRQDVAAIIANSNPEDDLFKIIEIAKRHPIWMACIAATITIMLQSSSATIGLIIGLMAGGINSMEIAFPAVIGTNIGLSLTTLAMGWKQIDSRRMALANLLLKVVVGIAMMVFQEPILMYLAHVPGHTAQHITYTHTGFNILVAIVGLPLVNQVNSLMERILPTIKQEVETFGPKYTNDTPSDIPALALGQSQREIVRVSEIVRQMLDDLWIALKTNDEDKVRQVVQRDDQVDLLDAHIKRYLAQLGSLSQDIANSREQINQLTYLTELENAGDIIDKNLSELVLKKIKLGVDFTPEGWQELDDFYKKVAQNLLIADTAFTTRDRVLAEQLLRHKEYLRNYERELRARHFARLNSHVAQTHETTAIHLDLLTHLKRINSGVSHVGFAILQEKNLADPPKEIKTATDT